MSILGERKNPQKKEGNQAKNNTKKKTRIFTTKAKISIIMKNENYLLNLHKIISLWYEDVQLKL